MGFRCFLSGVCLAVFLCAALVLPQRAWSAPKSPEGLPEAGAKVAPAPVPEPSHSETVIPGPLRSFERMAAISQQAAPDKVMQLFALNVFSHGYGSSRNKQKAHKPTEYLILVRGYLRQARQLQTLAGPSGVIRVSSCRQAKPLLEVLGYRLSAPCGPNTSLETANPDVAFLTIDSGFPLTQLGHALRNGAPFTYAYSSSRVPLLFRARDWTENAPNNHFAKGDVIGALLEDPLLARLYWALSQLDSQTRADLERSPGIRNLVPDAPILDFYGREICIRSGRVLVPGGPAADAAWQNLLGASPRNPGKFVSALLRRDRGWMAAYFDALSRVSPARQNYFTRSGHLKTFYEALRNRNPRPGPARAVFRTDQGLVMLVTRVPFNPDGRPHVPGNLSTWKKALQGLKNGSPILRRWQHHNRPWKRPEDLLTAMFTFSRMSGQSGPLQMYLMLCEIDRGRSPGQRLSPGTVRLLIDNFPRFSDQYLLFSEFPGLNNAGIALFVRVAREIDGIRSVSLRANTLGTFQAEIGLWQILARQREIPETALSLSFERLIRPFGRIGSPVELFEAGRASFEQLCRAATGRTDLSQDEFIALLAGPNPSGPLAAQVRQTIADRMRAVMTDQRLVSLDTLFELGSGLKEMAQGRAKAGALLPLAAHLHQFEMPHPIFTARQLASWSYGLSDARHTNRQAHVDLRKIIRSPRSPRQLLDARGLLAPFLRDSLVGLNYAYYEPPGEEMARNDPFFVRSQDFSGKMAMGGVQSWQTPFLVGRGWTAGGGAHLAGSLADLSYVLADVEQGFLVPRNTQALIWRSAVPTLLTDAVVPRWWGISRTELHAVALYQRAGEELLAKSARDPALREKVMGILSDRMLPAREFRIENALRAGHVKQALSKVTPADTFFLTAGFRSRFPKDTTDWGPSGRQLEALFVSDPAQVSFARLSRDFGVPHPALALTYSCQLLNVKPFPTLMGYASRLLAESWDSDNLYWARLADREGYAPVMLNILVPELTRRMVGNIFASYPGDWPALLRALRVTGEEFRQGQIASIPKPDIGPGVPVAAQQ